MPSRATMIPTIHVGLIASAAWLTLSFDFGLAQALAAIVVGVTPLLLAFPGLRANARTTQQWSAIALVFYVGIGVTETVASRARSAPAILLLFTSTTELSILLSLLRAGPRASRESAES